MLDQLSQDTIYNNPHKDDLIRRLNHIWNILGEEEGGQAAFKDLIRRNPNSFYQLIIHFIQTAEAEHHGGRRKKKKTRKKRGGCWPNCFKKKSNSNSGEFAKTKPPQEQEQEMPLIEQPNQQVRRRGLLRIPSMATLSEGKEKVENWQRSRSTSPTMDPFTAAHHNLPRDHFAKVDKILEKAAKKGLGGGRRKTRRKKNRKRRTKKKSRKRKRRK